MIPLRDDNPTRTAPVVTVGLIVINALVFLYELTLSRTGALEAFFASFTMVPAVVVHSPDAHAYLTVFTSMFLHGGWMHLIGNMLFLWIFGNNVEDSVGHVKFVFFYLISGVGAAIGHILSAPGAHVPVLGASGAISGVLGAYLLLFPHARVLTLLPLGVYSRIIYLPAWMMLVFWFAMQVFSGWFTGGSRGEGVAWWAHVGGFVAGMALIPIFKQRDVQLFAPAKTDWFAT